ncbi:MAG: lysine--tRNA ligase [Clostridia bacterium]|nr:lysine--tRNA ligase [Clostridia bacterium]
MHWSEEIAQRIVQRNPEKEEYVCAAGISPSGSIHIGNFRDIATSLFVVKALRKMGKKARLLFSWDEFDRFRHVPANVKAIPGNEDMDENIGRPYVDVRNPMAGSDAPNYAKYFEGEFEQAVKKFGIELDYRYQADMNRSGKYAPYVIQALKKRGEIFDILDSFRTQDAQEGERENYYPVAIYCPCCGKDLTHITRLSEDCTKAHYVCDCGHEGDWDFTKDFNCKLAWKIDWPMRWMYEGVDFEPGGKDHASPTGSYQTSKVISQKIFGYEPPLFQGYEFIGIKGLTGKMSGSSGLNMTPDTLLKLYQPEIILWLYSKTEPTKAFDFCFDDGILRQYFEFDKMYREYMDKTANETVSSIMYNCIIEGRTIETVPMSLLVQLGSIVDFNVPMLETVFAKIGQPYRYEQFADRLERAKYWLEACAPDQVNRLRTTRNFEFYETLSPELRQEISLLHELLSSGEYDLEGLNTALYAIPKKVFGEEMDQKTQRTVQGEFFKAVYRLLIDKEQGPRLYLFLYAIDRARYVHLLDFSTPQTEEEKRADAQAAMPEVCPAEPSKEVHEPDPVAPVKDEIILEDFAKLDFRVCKVLKAETVRKSRACLKLTLSDGLGERVIMSSIKDSYAPEELVGKKIVVVANLKPNRICNVTSEGMLLAASNGACGTKVLFVDDSVPEGTAIH